MADHKEVFDRIYKDRFDKIDATLENLNKRLFIDNGDKSIQSRINDNTEEIARIKKIFLWLGGTIISIIGLMNIHNLLTWLGDLFKK